MVLMSKLTTHLSPLKTRKSVVICRIRVICVQLWSDERLYRGAHYAIRTLEETEHWHKYEIIRKIVCTSKENGYLCICNFRNADNETDSIDEPEFFYRGRQNPYNPL